LCAIVPAIRRPPRSLIAVAFTAAIHVYGGDFFAAHRSEWDPETLHEQRSDGERARQLFEEANRQYAGGVK